MGDLECAANAPSESRCGKVERPLLDGTEITRFDGSVGSCGGLPALFEHLQRPCCYDKDFFGDFESKTCLQSFRSPASCVSAYLTFSLSL